LKRAVRLKETAMSLALHAARQPGRCRPPLSRVAMAAALATVSSAGWGGAPAAGALPTGGTVSAGQALISHPAPNLLRVQQDSGLAAIDWHSFDIGRDASVVFVQPSSRATVLNRVTGGEVSQIFGRLQANGRVFLLNPYGIVFGRDARVDVAGLVASTAGLRNDDFTAGRWRFATPGAAGAQLVNEGTITVREGGLAAFVAPSVVNRGSITARLGRVALAGGAAFTLDPYGDRLVQLAVPDAQLARVVNSGTLSADGGSVQLSTRTATAIVDGLINLAGVVQAHSVGERGGRIVLEGDSHTQIDIAAHLDASGLAAGERGGTISANAGRLAVGGQAVLDARGDSGGGQVELGSGWHGTGARVQVASQTVAAGATLDVSAVRTGQGGQAVVWSDGRTAFDGHVAARGGLLGGDGGRVEVSGRHLAFAGEVDASAEHGAPGTLLLDPGSLRLQSRSSGGTRDVAGPVDAAGSADDVVATESINTLLASGTSVQLSATQDIAVVDGIDARLVDAAGRRINRTGANLTLEAGGSLALGSFIVLDGGSFTGRAGGAIRQSAGSLAMGGGDVVLQAGTGISLQSLQDVRHLTLTTVQGNIDVAAPVQLSGRFSADVLQGAPGDRIRLGGVVAASADAQPAMSINAAAGNTGAAAVEIDGALVAAGDVQVRGAGVTLAPGQSIDTRPVSGGRTGSAVALAAGGDGLTLSGSVLTDGGSITLGSAGDLRQADASLLASGSGDIQLQAAGMLKLAQAQTTGLLQASATQLTIDAGTTATALQVGRLELHATGTAPGALDMRSSVALTDGESHLTSGADIIMQPGTVLEAGTGGSLTLSASGSIGLEFLKSGGAGVVVQSDHGDVLMHQALGGRAAGDAATVVTAGGDTVPLPTLYALDVRAPEGRIETQSLLLYGLKGLPVSIDLPAPAPLAYGLNLAAREVDVRGLVFVIDGAVSIQGSDRVVLGSSIRSANGHPMAVGGGEIDLYRPMRPNGAEYRNTDVVVAQYVDGSGRVTLRFFEQVDGHWQQSTSFLSVVMAADLPSPASGQSLPSFWLDRTQVQGGLSSVSLSDPAFAVNGSAPARLLSLVDATPTGSNDFTVDSRLASYDPAGLGRHPYVPLVYGPDQNDPALPGTQVLATPGGGQAAVVDIPGTRFVPKLLITNDPGPAFAPAMVTVDGAPITQIGRITLQGALYETDAQGHRLVHDINGGFESAGDLRNVAFKVASFDTRSVFQDSYRFRAPFGAKADLGVCSVANADQCLDNPGYIFDVASGRYNDYPRVVYPDSSASPRCEGTGCGAGRFDDPPLLAGQLYNPVSPGFQAPGYLSRACLSGGDCERPVATAPLADYYAAGEPAKPGANPNAPTSSIRWSGAQPGSASIGRFEYFVSLAGQTPFASPALQSSADFATVLGLTDPTNSQRNDTVKIGAAVAQASAPGTFAAPQPTRTVLSVSHGVIDGQGITMSTDGTSSFKSTLPSPSILSTDSGAPPTFSTILPGAPAALPGATSVGAGGATLPPVAVATPPSEATPTGGVINGLLQQPDEAAASGTQAAASQGADVASQEVVPLVLGGRGLAQSADLGRSGAWGAPRASMMPVDHEVACSDEPAPASAEPGLPRCR
jgi:filamentous hemagglutinin family protein